MPTTDLMDALPISDSIFTLQRQQEVSTQGSGAPRGSDIGEPLWVAKVTCSVVKNDSEARDIEGLIDELDGVIGSFYLSNVRFPFPRLDPGGVVLGASEVTIYALDEEDASVLRFAGLPVGYTLRRGDYFHFDAAGHRCLHKIVSATGTADGAGRTGFLKVRPFIRAGAETGLQVTLKKPAAEMFIVPGSCEARSIRPTLGAITFAAQQVP